MMANWLPQSSVDWLVSLVDPFSQGRLGVQASMISCQASPVAHLTSRHAYAQTHANKHAKVRTSMHMDVCSQKYQYRHKNGETDTKKTQRLLTNSSRNSWDLNITKATPEDSETNPGSLESFMTTDSCTAKQTCRQEHYLVA